MEHLESLVEFLKKSYNPEAIILAGSRASGKYRKSSDWDFTILVKKSPIERRQMVDGQYLDIRFIELPLPEDYELWTTWSPYKYNKIVLDNEEKLAQRIVENTNKAYQQGPKPLASVELQNRKQRLAKLVDKLFEITDDPELSMFYLGQMYFSIILRYWFELRQEWAVTVYEALPYIKDADPKYFESLSIIAGNSSLLSKANAAKVIYEQLFNQSR